MYSFSDSASSHIKNEKYDEALQLLNVVIIQEKNCKKIFPLIQKMRCEISTNRSSDAVATWAEVVKLIMSSEFENEDKSAKIKCETEIESIAEMFISTIKIDDAICLLKMQFFLSKQLHTGKKKLDKLSNLGIPIQELTKQLSIRSNAEKVQNIYMHFDEILNEMQATEKVDFKAKTLEISWLMKYYGVSCNHMQDTPKSIEVHNKALFHMKSTFGNHAGDYKVYCYMLHGYATALESDNRLSEAKQMYDDAMRCKEQAVDWLDDDDKMKSILITSARLHEVSIKLQS